MNLEKPWLRGKLHLIAFLGAMAACWHLLEKAHSKLSFETTAIYSATLIGLLGISALYHVPHWKPVPRKWLRRIDHSAIYALIAGTGTPVFALSLTPASARPILVSIWGLAGLGIAQSLFWVDVPKWVSASLYALTAMITVGMLLPRLNEIQSGLPTGTLTLIVTGGLIYAVGAAAYATRRPNPLRGIFGYHEVFHLLVTIAATIHFTAIYRLI